VEDGTSESILAEMLNTLALMEMALPITDAEATSAKRNEILDNTF